MKKVFLAGLTTTLFILVTFSSGFCERITLVQRSDKWNYTAIENDLWSNWDSVSHDSFDWDSAEWLTGNAAFGNTMSDAYPLPYNTYWAKNTDLALQKTIEINGYINNPVLKVASDNGVVVFVNGVEVLKANAEGYTEITSSNDNWEYMLTFSQDILVTGMNLIQVLAEDHGGITFFDMKLTANVEPIPTPEPATMFLLGSGLLGLAGARMRKKK